MNVRAFRLLSSVAVSLLPITALAHPGDHQGMAPLEAIEHVVTQPDHAGFLAAMVVLAIGGAHLVISRKAI